MTRIRLVNEDGRLVGKDPETGETVPLEFGETSLESVRTESAHPTRSMQVRNARQFSGGTGGERIEAALADLPERGGMVFVPPAGPDSVDGEDGVWAVESTIPVDGGQYLVGAGPGWHVEGTGTTLRATSETTMLRLGGTFLNGVFDLRIDGTATATACLDMGRDQEENDYVARNAMIHGARGYGVCLRGRRNFWVDQCWIEECGTAFEEGGIATQGSTVRDTVWITNVLFFGNVHDIVFAHDSDTTVQKVWIANLRSDTAGRHAIAQRGAAPIRDVWIVRPHITAAGLASGGWDAMNFAGDAEALSIVGPTIRGNAITRHGINRELGSWTDCTVRDVYTDGLTGNRLAGVAGAENGTRTLVDGLGYNGDSDPGGAGDWNGHGQEGVRVAWRDDGTEMLAEYVDGQWFSREL